MASIFIFSLLIATCNGMVCNGMKGLCRLRLDQVTLAGSHNSAAGASGKLVYHKLFHLPALPCFYNSQSLSFTKQLNLGIRYFDIDACWDTFYTPHAPWACHRSAYATRVDKIIDEVHVWMERHPNEVIVLHFNRDSTEVQKTGPAIWNLVKKKWKNNQTNLSIQTNSRATLGDCIRTNKRIFIMFSQPLAGAIQESGYLEERMVGFTWKQKHGVSTTDVKELIGFMDRNRCYRESFHTYVRYDMYLSWGLCNGKLASLVRPFIKQGVVECYRGTVGQKKTVNFIPVDYVDKTVVEVARSMNKFNVKMF